MNCELYTGNNPDGTKFTHPECTNPARFVYSDVVAPSVGIAMCSEHAKAALAAAKKQSISAGCKAISSEHKSSGTVEGLHKAG